MDKIDNSIILYPRTLSPLNFRGDNVPIQQNDTVEINNKPKKDKDNLGIKLLLGGLVLGGAVLVGIKLHKLKKVQEVFKSEFKNIENIRKNLSEIFEKDLTVKEADEFAKNYKRICEVKNDEEFAEKLFEQLKKDYGFENSHIKLQIQDFTSQNIPQWKAKHTDLGHLVLVSRVDGKLSDREDLFVSLFHELKHHKQFETAIATDRFAFEDAIVHKKLKEYTKEQINNNGGEQAVKSWLKEKSHPFLKPEIERIEQEIGQLPKESPLYKRGLKYIEVKRNYVQEEELTARAKDYEGNILEVEAKRIGELARELFNKLFQ